MVEWIEIKPYSLSAKAHTVSTLVVEWIEMQTIGVPGAKKDVSTLVVEWIEIKRREFQYLTVKSPPSWWSGLKFG